MTIDARNVGRNDRCPCGSGKKYKQCHAAKAAGWSRSQIVVVALMTVVLVGGLMLALTNRQEHTGQPTGVWSEEHGHYH